MINLYWPEKEKENFLEQKSRENPSSSSFWSQTKVVSGDDFEQTHKKEIDTFLCRRNAFSILLMQNWKFWNEYLFSLRLFSASTRTAVSSVTFSKASTVQMYSFIVERYTNFFRWWNTRNTSEYAKNFKKQKLNKQ